MGKRLGFRWLAAALVLCLCACGDSSGRIDPRSGSSSGAGSSSGGMGNVASARVTGPIGTAGVKGFALWDTPYRLSDIGYVEEEYFISGRANTYTSPTTQADYTTRFIVRRPADAAAFNGTVVLEWVNVSAQFENAVDIISAHQLFHRDGYAYVHVSAQAAGLCCTPLTPKTWDPVRYAAINHPGDDYSFDMFSQIAREFKSPSGIDPMGGLRVEKIIAVGQSQSGQRMHTYLNTVQADAGVIDAFLVHADAQGNKQYAADPLVPTIQLLSEREASPAAPNVRNNYRLWEAAGASHQEYWIGVHQIDAQAPRTAGAAQTPASSDETLHAKAANFGEQIEAGQLLCVVEGAQFPVRYLVMSAIDWLNRWARTGAAPPQGPRYSFTAAGALARDADGNALGGIRLPPMVAPIARYRSADCNLGGITIPFTDAEIAARYGSHADYLCRMKAATEASVTEGFLLRPDADELMQRVEGAANRFAVAGVRDC